MANQRYYIECPICKEKQNMGKSSGEGIYHVEHSDTQKINIIYEFMWNHMMECHKDEWKEGELFKIISE